MANISSYNQLSSWNEDDDLLFVQQPDAPKKAHPSQMKEYVEAGDFEATGEIIDGHGNLLSDVVNQIASKIKKLPTQTTRYNFTAANTYQYTGVNVSCPAGHTYIVRALLVYSNSEPKGILASSRPDSMRMYECYTREELATYITFMLVGGESAYIWSKGSTVAGDDVRLDVIDITN